MTCALWRKENLAEDNISLLRVITINKSVISEPKERFRNVDFVTFALYFKSSAD